jgi:enamine deaminase RidA (YjgF/YER057c/UK114 family)
MHDTTRDERRARTWYRPPALSWNAGLAASPAVRAGDLLFVAGQVARAADGTVVGRGDAMAQARYALERVRALVEEAGGTLDDVVDIVSFHRDPRDIPLVMEAAGEIFDSGFPAWTPVGFLGTYDPALEVSIRAIAHLGTGPKRCLSADSVPKLAGFDVPGACGKGDLLFVAGQTAAGLEGVGGLHVAQARPAYERMLEVVGAAGGSLDDILDFASFHQDIRGAPDTFDEVYVPSVLGDRALVDAPTTSHIGATALHEPGLVGTYRCLADLGGGRRVGSLPDTIWWKGILPISGATRKEHGSLIAVAGHVASDPDGGIVAPGDVAGQTRYIFDSMAESLAGLGATLEDVVEVTSFYKEPRALGTIMDVAAEYFDREHGPAWTPAAVPGLWVEGFLAEISAIAVV